MRSGTPAPIPQDSIPILRHLSEDPSQGVTQLALQDRLTRAQGTPTIALLRDLLLRLAENAEKDAEAASIRQAADLLNALRFRPDLQADSPRAAGSEALPPLYMLSPDGSKIGPVGAALASGWRLAHKQALGFHYALRKLYEVREYLSGFEDYFEDDNYEGAGEALFEIYQKVMDETWMGKDPDHYWDHFRDWDAEILWGDVETCLGDGSNSSSGYPIVFGAWPSGTRMLCIEDHAIPGVEAERIHALETGTVVRDTGLRLSDRGMEVRIHLDRTGKAWTLPAANWLPLLSQEPHEANDDEAAAPQHRGSAWEAVTEDADGELLAVPYLARTTHSGTVVTIKPEGGLLKTYRLDARDGVCKRSYVSLGAAKLDAQALIDIYGYDKDAEDNAG